MPYDRNQIESIIIEELATWPGLPRSMYWARLQTRIKAKGWPKILDKMIEDGKVYLTARIVGGRVVTVLNVHPDFIPVYPAHYNSPAASLPARYQPASVTTDANDPDDADDPDDDAPVDIRYK